MFLFSIEFDGFKPPYLFKHRTALRKPSLFPRSLEKREGAPDHDHLKDDRETIPTILFCFPLGRYREALILPILYSEQTFSFSENSVHPSPNVNHNQECEKCMVKSRRSHRTPQIVRRKIPEFGVKGTSSSLFRGLGN